MRAGRMSAARRVFRRGAANLQEEYGPLLLAWAQVESRSKNISQARVLFERSVECVSSTAHSYVAWGNFEAHLENNEKAKTIFREGLDRFPVNTRLLESLVHLERKMGNFSDVRELLCTLLAKDANNVVTWQMMGELNQV